MVDGYSQAENIATVIIRRDSAADGSRVEDVQSGRQRESSEAIWFLDKEMTTPALKFSGFRLRLISLRLSPARVIKVTQMHHFSYIMTA